MTRSIMKTNFFAIASLLIFLAFPAQLLAQEGVIASSYYEERTMLKKCGTPARPAMRKR